MPTNIAAMKPPKFLATHLCRFANWMRTRRHSLFPGSLLFTVVIAACGAAYSQSRLAPKPSFDCKRASSDVERMICSSSELSDLDGRLWEAYDRLRRRNLLTREMVAEQRTWLKSRNACANVECIASMYFKRLYKLEIVVVATPTEKSPRPITQVAPDSVALEKLRGLVAKADYFMSKYIARTEAEMAYCSGFMHALRLGTSIRAIEPINRAESISDLSLSQWKECGKKFDGGPDFDPQFLVGRSFRHYRVDIDNDPSNGLEDILYSESDFTQGGGSSGFSWWELSKCKVMGGAGFEQDDKRDATGYGTLAENFALIVDYSGMIGILTLSAYDATLMQGPQTKWQTSKRYHLSFERMTTIENVSGPIKNFQCAWITFKNLY